MSKKRQTYCWIVEVLCNATWKPFYEGNPNSTRDWALWEMKKWMEKYGGSKFRIAKYVAERDSNG